MCFGDHFEKNFFLGSANWSYRGTLVRFQRALFTWWGYIRRVPILCHYVTVEMTCQSWAPSGAPFILQKIHVRESTPWIMVAVRTSSAIDKWYMKVCQDSSNLSSVCESTGYRDQKSSLMPCCRHVLNGIRDFTAVSANLIRVWWVCCAHVPGQRHTGRQHTWSPAYQSLLTIHLPQLQGFVWSASRCCAIIRTQYRVCTLRAMHSNKFIVRANHPASFTMSYKYELITCKWHAVV